MRRVGGGEAKAAATAAVAVAVVVGTDAGTRSTSGEVISLMTTAVAAGRRRRVVPETVIGLPPGLRVWEARTKAVRELAVRVVGPRGRMRGPERPREGLDGGGRLNIEAIIEAKLGMEVAFGGAGATMVGPTF